MKTFLLIAQLAFVSVTFSQFSDEQQQQIDSLNQVINNPTSSAVDVIFSYNQLTDIMHVVNLDTVYYMGNLADSIATMELAAENLNSDTRIQLLRGKAAAQNSIGVYHYFNGRLQQAIEYFELSLATRKKIGDKNGLSESLNNLGFIYSNLGRTDVALDYYDKSLELREQLKDTGEVIISLNNIGAIYYKTGNYVEATKKYEEAYAYSLVFESERSQAIILNNVANVYRVMGNGERAIELFIETAAIYEKIGDQNGLSSVLTNVGYSYMVKGNLEAAQQYFNRSLKIAIDEKSISNQGFIHSNLSTTYYTQQKYDEALHQGQLSYELFTELGQKKDMAIAANNIARAYNELGQTDSAKAYYNLAADYANESRSIEQLTNTYRELAVLSAEQKENQQAISFVHQLIDIRNNELKSNFIVLAEREKELYFKTMDKDYMLYYFLTAENIENDSMQLAAYNNALRIKELSLKSTAALRNNILQSENFELITLYNNWIKYKKTIAKYYAEGKDTKNLEKESNSMEKELISKSDLFKSFEQAQSLTWQNVQGGLEKNQVAIEFVHYSLPKQHNQTVYYSALLLKKQQAPKLIPLCTEQELQSILGKLQGNNLKFVNEIYGTREQTDKRLYELIWKPIEQHLKGVNEIYLSPSGLFHKISFSALSNQKGELLSQQYHLHTISSTGKIINQTEKIETDLSFGLFGGAQFSSSENSKEIWSYLPGTLKEINNISAQLPSDKTVRKFTGNQATETNFKQVAPTCNVLHIATHGYFYPDPETVNNVIEEDDDIEDLEFRGGAYGYWSFVENKNPLMRSGLALSGANDVWTNEKQASENDGVLTAQEVATLNLSSTELVVLSACETGLGDIKGSEGVYGLQRAFKMAGVHYVIMSLWQVPDAETAEFMTTFYQLFLKSKDIPSAFRATQLQMQKRYDPYYWAAFVLIE